ncbi:hypothetical protein Pan216_21060 [Planctomycetes bacterium Pan216]|uniref:Uncharacterized protein n=1 Tax=Kolteria novifilia TaxID=2527975 RepID=A0A518B2T1_9BACT|nr:hypothetical protein Pan216_21060 [Planctomycetes bacterium Pan216]
MCSIFLAAALSSCGADVSFAVFGPEPAKVVRAAPVLNFALFESPAPKQKAKEGDRAEVAAEPVRYERVRIQECVNGQCSVRYELRPIYRR